MLSRLSRFPHDGLFVLYLWFSYVRKFVQCIFMHNWIMTMQITLKLFMVETRQGVLQETAGRQP